MTTIIELRVNEHLRGAKLSESPRETKAIMDDWSRQYMNSGLPVCFVAKPQDVDLDRSEFSFSDYELSQRKQLQWKQEMC